MIVTVTLNPSLDEWVTLPRLRPGALNRATDFARYPGGKGINVSRVAHELGHPTLAIALAGGMDGRILGTLLRQARIPHRLIDVPGSTRNNYQLFSSATRELTQINSPGPQVSSSHVSEVAQLLRRSCSQTACAVFSGSLPPGAAAQTYQWLIREACGKALTVLDASGDALRQGLRARPWLIKPNREEAEELLGARLRTPKQVVRGAMRLLARGPSIVIISLGAEGAVLADRESGQTLRAVPPKVRADSAVGAGDSLVAGFVIGWLKTRSLTEALRLGIACGAATAMTPGTELCHRADVRRLLPQVTVTQVEV